MSVAFDSRWPPASDGGIDERGRLGLARSALLSAAAARSGGRSEMTMTTAAPLIGGARRASMAWRVAAFLLFVAMAKVLASVFGSTSAGGRPGYHFDASELTAAARQIPAVVARWERTDMARARAAARKFAAEAFGGVETEGDQGASTDDADLPGEDVKRLPGEGAPSGGTVDGGAPTGPESGAGTDGKRERAGDIDEEGAGVASRAPRGAGGEDVGQSAAVASDASATSAGRTQARATNMASANAPKVDGEGAALDGEERGHARPTAETDDAAFLRQPALKQSGEQHAGHSRGRFRGGNGSRRRRQRQALRATTTTES